MNEMLIDLKTLKKKVMYSILCDNMPRTSEAFDLWKGLLNGMSKIGQNPHCIL